MGLSPSPASCFWPRCWAAHFLGGGSSVPGIRSHHGNLASWGHLAKGHKCVPHAGGQGAGAGLLSPQKEQKRLSFSDAWAWRETKVTLQGPLPTCCPTQPCAGAAGLLLIRKSCGKMGPRANALPSTGAMGGRFHRESKQGCSLTQVMPWPCTPGGCPLSTWGTWDRTEAETKQCGEALVTPSSLPSRPISSVGRTLRCGPWRGVSANPRAHVCCHRKGAHAFCLPSPLGKRPLGQGASWGNCPKVVFTAKDHGRFWTFWKLPHNILRWFREENEAHYIQDHI